MRNKRMTLSSVFPDKSVQDFVTARIMAFIRECGCEMVVPTVGLVALALRCVTHRRSLRRSLRMLPMLALLRDAAVRGLGEGFLPGEGLSCDR